MSTTRDQPAGGSEQSAAPLEISTSPAELARMLSYAQPKLVRRAVANYLAKIPPFRLGLETAEQPGNLHLVHSAAAERQGRPTIIEARSKSAYDVGFVAKNPDNIRLAAGEPPQPLAAEEPSRSDGQSANGLISWDISKKILQDRVSVLVRVRVPGLAGARLRVLLDGRGVTGTSEEPDLVFETCKPVGNLASGEIPLSRFRYLGATPDSVLQLGLAPGRVFAGRSGTVRVCCFAFGGVVTLTGGDDKTLRMWDLAEGKALLEMQGHEGPITACSFEPLSNLAATASLDGTVRVWDLELGKCAQVLKGHEGPVYACAFGSDESQLVTGGADQVVRLWDIHSAEPLLVLEGHSDRITAVAMNDDCNLAISGSDDKTVRVWNIETGERRELYGHAAGVTCVATTRDGNRVISSSDDKTVRVWDLDSGEGKVLTGHSAPVTSVAITPDGCSVISGSEDKTLRVWNLENGKSWVLGEANGGITCCAIDADALQVAAGTNDGSFWIWDIEGPSFG